jgi:peptidyl-prolyl cis-trans isomerase C
MRRHTTLITAAALGLALALPVQADEPTADTVLARVGEVEITLGHALALREQLPQQFLTLPDETLFPAIVEQLIEQELLHQFKGDDLNRRERAMLENELRNFSANAALTEAAEAALSDAAIEDAYEAFAAEFAEGEAETEYNAAHILVQTEEEIEQVIAELDDGRAFAEVAREYSIDGSAQAGGDLGWFGEGVMIPPFEQAVMALEPGEVSGPVETQFGWHVVQLIDRRDAQVPPLAEVREDLAAQIQREAARSLVEELRAETEVENLAGDMEPGILSRRELLDD